ncbi:MAG: CapA family protein, partial [Myxococcales bacterium]|nr:CapA family protein [Myxococcales bacterium]
VTRNDLTPRDSRARVRVWSAAPRGPRITRLAGLVLLGSLLGSLWVRPIGRADEPDAVPLEGGQALRHCDLAATGDLLLHIKVVATGRAHGWDRVFAGLGEALEPGDLAFANLETPLVEDVLPVRTGSPPILGAPGEVAAALARAGITVVGAANNHAYDQQSSGLARTLEALEAAGVGYVGAHREQAAVLEPLIIERGGVRVAFLSFTDRVNRGPGARPVQAHIARSMDAGVVAEAIREARERAEIVVVGIHWSHDFVEAPSYRQRARARQMVELGADFVVGTGPHILHPVEILPSPRGQAVVAYSLGNAVSNQGQRYRIGRRVNREAHPAVVTPEPRDGALLRLRFALDARGELHVERLLAVGLWTENNFFRFEQEGERDVHVRRLAAVDEATRAERWPRIQAALGAALTVVP